MTDSPSHRVRITPAVPSAALSRARRQFNTLIQRLEAERRRLAEWHDTLPRLNQLSQDTFMPLLRTLNECRKQMALLFDQAWDHPSMTRRDKEKLEDLACSMAMDLLDDGYDDELAAIVKKYTAEPHGEDGAATSAEELAQFRQNVEAMFGVDLGDEAGLDTREALFEALDRKMHEAQQEQASRQKAQADSGRPERPPSKRELQQQAEAARLQLSVREIYRKLVSSLHPDREPDPDERQRKTALMQRVNVAYEKNDLLGLLELQLEVDHIDQAGLDSLDEERIAQYNKILRRQVADLGREIGQLEYGVQQELGLELDHRPTPRFIMNQLKKDIADVRRQIAQAEADLVKFRDVKRLKAWLKSYRIPEPDAFDFGSW